MMENNNEEDVSDYRERKQQETLIEAKLRSAWAEVQEAKRTGKKLLTEEEFWAEIEKD